LEYRQYFTNQPPRGRKDPDAPRRVLAVRAKYGAVSGTIPFFEQYFAGGSNSIRGYDEDRFWGKYTLQTSIELRLPIQRSFNTVLFVDYGGAWGGFGSVNDFKQSDKFKMHVGYGIGLSFRTPLGPIRVDFGFNEEKGSRTHFLIGTSF
jgi:outer membrane protein insertion porin family